MPRLVSPCATKFLNEAVPVIAGEDGEDMVSRLLCVDWMSRKSTERCEPVVQVFKKWQGCGHVRMKVCTYVPRYIVVCGSFLTNLIGGLSV
jgi:hypothetical protein